MTTNRSQTAEATKAQPVQPVSSKRSVYSTKSTSGQDQSDPEKFRKRKNLTSAERRKYVHLYKTLEKYRTLVVEYLLLRASLAHDVREKKAWWILDALLVFVETNHHFPLQEEMNPYLDTFLSKEVSPDLPKLSQLDLLELKELVSQLKVCLKDYET